MPNTLRTIEGIVTFLSIEENKSVEECKKDLSHYINKQHEIHPQRNPINIARGYLVHILQKSSISNYER